MIMIEGERSRRADSWPSLAVPSSCEDASPAEPVSLTCCVDCWRCMAGTDFLVNLDFPIFRGDPVLKEIEGVG